MSDARPSGRVLILSERADFYGGGQKSLLEIAAGLAGSGAATPIVTVPGPGPLADALGRARVEVRRLPLPSLRNPLAAGLALIRLARLLRASGCDLVHTHSPRAALYAGLAGRALGIPHLFHARASRPAAPPAEILLAALSDGVAAVSRAAAARSAALRRHPALSIVPTGIPRPAILGRDAARAALALPPDAPIAGVVGRVEPDKGSETAIAALPVVRRRSPDAVLAFLGACDPAAPWTRVLRRRATALGVAGAVRFLGDWPEAARLLPAFDLLLHPSRHEALPRVLIEAAYAGVPAVAADVGGVGDVIEDGVTGILIPPGDAEALGEAAGRLLADPERRAALGRAAARRAPERFGRETMLAGILALYDAARRRRARRAAAREAIP